MTSDLLIILVIYICDSFPKVLHIIILDKILRLQVELKNLLDMTNDL